MKTKYVQKPLSARQRVSTLVLAMLALWLYTPTTARAQLGFQFVNSPPILAGAPGATLSFFALLDNTSGAPILLQGFNPGLTDPGLTVNDLFFTNVPDPLPTGPGPVAGYNLFNVVISASALAGTYTGTARIDYDTSSAVGLSVSRNYAIVVLGDVIPEPGTGALLAPAVLLVGVIRRRKPQPR